MAGYTFRTVRETDVDEILNIYRPYIENSAITFEYTVPSAEEFKERINSISKDYPYIVCIHDDKVVGYAYAHRHMERAAYQWNAELSVYVDAEHQGHGLGETMYRILFDILKLQNIRNVYAGITLPNEKSLKMHKKLGFLSVGVYHNTGYKCGKWHDVEWLEKSITIHDAQPDLFISLKKIDETTISKILDNHSLTSYRAR